MSMQPADFSSKDFHAKGAGILRLRYHYAVCQGNQFTHDAAIVLVAKNAYYKNQPAIGGHQIPDEHGELFCRSRIMRTVKKNIGTFHHTLHPAFPPRLFKTKP